MSEISVLIVEDDPLIADDIKGCLDNMDYNVFHIAYNMDDAIQSIQDQKPDIALLDINLGNNMDGLKIAELFTNQYYIPFVFLTSYSSKMVLEKAKQSRPMGYIVKPFDESDLFTTLEIALFNFAKSNKPEKFTREYINQKLIADLTPKEFDILKDIYHGKTNKQLTDIHHVSLSTIKTHVQRIYDKLDCHTRSETMALIREFLIG